MVNPVEIKKDFLKYRDDIFNNSNLQKDAFKFCVAYSLLVEEYIFRIFAAEKFNFALASAGSFSRRELSPYSDIDIMFIVDPSEDSEDAISGAIQLLWDCGIEVSHTVRDYYDIEKYIKDDLHAFTQFFETRFLSGSEKVYCSWRDGIFSSIAEHDMKNMIYDFFDDIQSRYNKYGSSSKVLEPNVKYSAGGLRDLQAVEWMYSLKNNVFLTEQNEITQTESFINLLYSKNVVAPNELRSVIESYKFVLNARNILHLLSKQRNDRLDFTSQEKIAEVLQFKGENIHLEFMKQYFEASNTLNRFSKTMMRKFEGEITHPLSDYLAIELDTDVRLKGNELTLVDKNKPSLSLSEILRFFYYRGLHSARFDENLRSLVIESVREMEEPEFSEYSSSVFFREILRMPKKVGDTLFHMNELGVLKLILPPFKDMIGFFQPGVYHNFTADEHTLIAIKNAESLYGEESLMGRIYTGLKEKDILFLSILFHDIAKPISISGHEILGAELAASIMERLGYSEKEIRLVKFLVAQHLVMEQVAFRRNLNDPATLDNFASRFTSLEELDFLFLLTFADLSAVNPMVWTEWKSELLSELYSKSRSMLQQQLTGEEYLYSSVMNFPFNGESDNQMQDHIDAIHDDIGYVQYFTEEEISQHLSEIERGSSLSIFFKEMNAFTNITIVTKDSPSLLSKICGVLAINDLNIHDARIFTRKDGIVIDSFNVSDFRTHKVIEEERYQKVEEDLKAAVEGELQLIQEIKRMKSKWWRLENKFFKRSGKIKIAFEEHEKYTILDVFSPDRLGLLFQITKKMSDLGLSIYFAKISTKSDDVVDSFYLLDRNGKKVSESDYELIRFELTTAIEQIL